MKTTAHGTECLNSLLRGELAATETYQQAMAKLRCNTEAPELRRLHDDHCQAANTLRQHIHLVGGQPDQGSGAWGTLAKLVEGTATLFGKKAALTALKKGEEQGIKDYEAALRDNDLPVECKSLIQNQLLFQTREHVSSLERMMVSK